MKRSILLSASSMTPYGIWTSCCLMQTVAMAFSFLWKSSRARKSTLVMMSPLTTKKVSSRSRLMRRSAPAVPSGLDSCTYSKRASQRSPSPKWALIWSAR
ncbi:MAG: hypothetical protein M0D55_02090 [Elusimicrobiota bacterium]|nr:MAG: hypothetical protein M0D55_02090 [Elusimicrobiota bacterium]